MSFVNGVIKFAGVAAIFYFGALYGLPLLGLNTANTTPTVNAKISGTMSVGTDYCTFSNGAKDSCWIPEGKFEITNNGSRRMDDVVIQIDFYNCDGVAEASQSVSTCRAAARVHMVCEKMYIDPRTRAGCTAKSYERGSRPWSEEWMWTARAIT